MNLSVLDRVIVLTILPKEGNFATLKILQDMRMALAFTEKELKKFNLQSNDETGQTTWEGDEEVDIPMGEKATDIVAQAFKDLDKGKKLQVDMMTTYEKFITTE
jgi:hypothetical protein